MQPRRLGIRIVPTVPALFVNDRSSRETELLAVHLAHVGHKKVGNTAKVAQQHDLQVTDADFDRAAGILGTRNAAHEPLRAVTPSENPLLSREMRKAAIYQIPSTGIEPVTFNFGG